MWHYFLDALPRWRMDTVGACCNFRQWHAASGWKLAAVAAEMN